MASTSINKHTPVVSKFDAWIDKSRETYQRNAWNAAVDAKKAAKKAAKEATHGKK